MPTIHDLTTAQLKQAIQIRGQIESLQAKLTGLLGASGPVSKAKGTHGRTKAKVRTMSAEARSRIAAAQHARWAKLRGTTAPAKPVAKKSAPAKAAPVKAAPTKRSFSPETRAKLAAAMKARWAARKKGAPAPNAPAK